MSLTRRNKRRELRKINQDKIYLIKKKGLNIYINCDLQEVESADGMGAKVFTKKAAELFLKENNDFIKIDLDSKVFLR